MNIFLRVLDFFLIFNLFFVMKFMMQQERKKRERLGGGSPAHQIANTRLE